MAGISGKSGSVKIGANTVVDVSEWSFNPTVGMLPDTALGDEDDTFVPDVGTSTATVTCWWNMGDVTGQKAMQDAFIAKTALAVKLYTDATHYYSVATAYITAMPVTLRLKTLTGITFNLQPSGGWTYA